MPKSAMNSLAKCLHHLSDKDKKRMLSSIKTLSDSENIMFECALELHGSKEAREMFQTMSHVENDPVEQAYREFMDASERKSIKGTDEYERYRDVLREMDKDNVKRKQVLREMLKRDNDGIQALISIFRKCEEDDKDIKDAIKDVLKLDKEKDKVAVAKLMRSIKKVPLADNKKLKLFYYPY